MTSPSVLSLGAHATAVLTERPHTRCEGTDDSEWEGRRAGGGGHMFPSPVPHRVAVDRCSADEDTRDLRRTMTGARAGSVHSVMAASVKVRLRPDTISPMVKCRKSRLCVPPGRQPRFRRNGPATEVVAGPIVRRYWGRWIRGAGSPYRGAKSQNGYCLEFDLSIVIQPEPASPCGVPGILFKLR